MNLTKKKTKTLYQKITIMQQLHSSEYVKNKNKTAHTSQIEHILYSFLHYLVAREVWSLIAGISMLHQALEYNVHGNSSTESS